MKLYAFAAFLALMFFSFSDHSAQAGSNRSVVHKFFVVKDAVVFGCDSYHCETNLKVHRGIFIKAKCRNGWCKMRTLPFKNAWVLESCLKHVPLVRVEDDEEDDSDGDSEGDGDSDEGDSDSGDSEDDSDNADEEDGEDESDS